MLQFTEWSNFQNKYQLFRSHISQNTLPNHFRAAAAIFEFVDDLPPHLREDLKKNFILEVAPHKNFESVKASERGGHSTLILKNPFGGPSRWCFSLIAVRDRLSNMFAYPHHRITSWCWMATALIWFGTMRLFCGNKSKIACLQFHHKTWTSCARQRVYLWYFI